MALVSYKNLKALREKHKGKRMVFCSGVFDLTHAGHILFFEDCKKQGDILIVAVGVDRSVRGIKGKNRPILNQYVRMKMVDSLKPVDYCLWGLPAPQSNLHAFIEKILKRLQPDKYIINEDAFDIPARKKMMEKIKATKLVILKRRCPAKFEDISTTKIIEKIKKDAQ